ncbi:CGNR zinc finger domain-containing protein [Streptomyces sp. NPDC003717]|uniref:CGNR zinc finger domain-containing protein n=1 Tax=Streptomyces sp. NPDC003717 TaxID=3154276 RepID=UPI0033AB02B6
MSSLPKATVPVRAAASSTRATRVPSAAGRPDRRGDREVADQRPPRLLAAPADLAAWSAGITEILAEVACAACALLGLPASADVRRCAAPSCSRLFLDHFRAWARRWCDKKGCGAHVDSASYRRRRTRA